MARPDERRFVTFQRGEVRDKVILAALRNGLRTMVSPDTGVYYTEDEIARATQPGSAYYIEADAIDLYGQAAQQRASWFADQTVPSRASSSYLAGVHQPLWLPDGKLPAAGAVGQVTATAPAGTIWSGSTTIGDASARVAREVVTGKRFQVYVTTTTPASGSVPLTLRAIDGGSASNIPVGAVLKWVNPPSGADPNATVVVQFDGGADAETDAEFANRVESAMRYRPGAGNRAHFRAWAMEATSAVEDAFVYANGLHAGSVVVCITQKRGAFGVGPLARVPSSATLADVNSYLVPPSSPVVPGNVHVLVVAPASLPTSVSVRLGLARNSAGGWFDAAPWPGATDAYPLAFVTTVFSQTTFQVTTDSSTATPFPALMMWNAQKSKFERLAVSNVSVASTNVWQVTLSSQPSFTIANGAVVCPYTDRLDVISDSAQAYFDSLGPGEVVDLSSDVRAVRAYRFPRTNQDTPSKLNFKLVSNMLEDLGGAADDGDLYFTNPTIPIPPVPASVSLGPNMLTLSQLGVYDQP